MLVAAIVSSWLMLGSGAPSASAAATAQPAPTVVLVPHEGLGIVLADPDGWTLYTWDGDVEGMSNCYDACASAWPPYTITGDLIAPDDLPASLGLIDRGDGTWQVTIDNWPLYYFAGDAMPGDVNGNQVNGFGATWWVMAYQPEEPPVTVVVVPPPAIPPPAAQPTPPPPAPIVTSPPVVAMPPATPTPTHQTVQVSIVDFEFRAPSINVQVGDTVTWTNNGRQTHTATADNGAFDSGRLNAGQTFSFTFNAAGSFPYHCALHPNMHGVVNVGGATGPAVGGQPFQPNFGPPVVDQGPYYGPPPYPPIDTNPYDNYPPGAYPPGAIPPGPGAPGYAPLITVTVPTNGTVILTWAPVPNAISYRIYSTPANTPLNLQVVSTVNQSLGGPPVTQTALASQQPGQTNLYQVRAVDTNGLETVVPSASPQSSPGGPTLPTGPLTVSGTTGNSVSLTWTALPGAVTYRVLQSGSPGGPFTASSAGTITGTTATVTGLSPNTTYFFQVVPVDATGSQGPPTNTVQATTTVSLPAPANLTLVSTTGSTVTLSWSASPGATAYRVLVAVSPAGPFNPATTSALTTSGGTVTGLNSNTTYYFQVVALDANGNQSVPSNTIAATTGAP